MLKVKIFSNLIIVLKITIHFGNQQVESVGLVEALVVVSVADKFKPYLVAL